MPPPPTHCAELQAAHPTPLRRPTCAWQSERRCRRRLMFKLDAADSMRSQLCCRCACVCGRLFPGPAPDLHAALCPPSLCRRPTCRLFIADSLCCEDYGIVQHASIRLWLVCNADVYLPEPSCLTGGWEGSAGRGPGAALACAPTPLCGPGGRSSQAAEHGTRSCSECLPSCRGQLPPACSGGRRASQRRPALLSSVVPVIICEGVPEFIPGLPLLFLSSQCTTT
jgi:hypothetical protein